MFDLCLNHGLRAQGRESLADDDEELVVSALGKRSISWQFPKLLVDKKMEETLILQKAEKNIVLVTLGSSEKEIENDSFLNRNKASKLTGRVFLW